MELRPFVSADYEALISWFADEQSLLNWAGPGVSWPLDRTQLDERMELSDLHSWTACQPSSTEPIGHIELLRMSPELAQIDRVAIAPAHRGRGLAVGLVGAAVTQARVDGFRTVELVVFADNLPAVRTYLTAGFVDVGAISPDHPSVRCMLVELGQ